MNVRDIAQSATGDIGQVDAAMAQKWVADRFVELTTVTLAKPMRRLLELTIPATVTAGNATATNGSKTVTGDATAIAAWSNSLVKRFFKSDSKNGWYEIAAFSNDVITLKTSWTEDTVTTSGYTIVTRQVALPKELRAIGAMRDLRHNTPILRISLDDLDLREPGRTQRAGGPIVFSEISINDNEERVLEFYPYSSDEVLVAYTGYLKPERLAGHQEVPSYVDPYLLIEGVKMNIFEHKMGLALEAGNADVGATWGNLHARQRTVWKGAKTDFIANSESVDDAKFILESYGSSGRSFGSESVSNARDYYFWDWAPLT